MRRQPAGKFLVDLAVEIAQQVLQNVASVRVDPAVAQEQLCLLALFAEPF